MEEFFSISQLIKTILSLTAVLALATIVLSRLAPYLKKREAHRLKQLEHRKQNRRQQESEQKTARSLPGDISGNPHTALTLIQRLDLDSDAALFLVEDENGQRDLFSLDATGLRLVKDSRLGAAASKAEQGSEQRAMGASSSAPRQPRVHLLTKKPHS